MVMKKVITVSIVDNETGFHKFVIDYLNASENIRCVSAYASAEKALVHLPRDRPDVIMIDINLGEFDGIECVRLLTTLIPETQLLALTVFDDIEKIFRALSAGANGYLLKRLLGRKLQEAIIEVCGGCSNMSAPIARKVVAAFKSASVHGNESVDLSPCEYSVLAGLTKGLPCKQIADQLGVTVYTIQSCISGIYEKLHVLSRMTIARNVLRKQT